MRFWITKKSELPVREQLLSGTKWVFCNRRSRVRERAGSNSCAINTRPLTGAALTGRLLQRSAPESS